MKKLLLFFTTVLAVQFASAQYCGNSGPSICTPGTYANPGLYPQSDSLPPFINGTSADATIGLKNFNQVVYSGFTLTVQSLRVDTIDNLPAGLCWATNKIDNTFANQENGCIHVSGTTCATPGQYKLRIIVTVDVGITTQQIDADAAGLHYYVRVNNRGEATTAVDTTQTASNALITYGPAADCFQLNVSDHSVCNGANDTLSANIVPGVAPYTYAWSVVSGNSLSCNNCAHPVATITQNSVYAVTVTDNNGISLNDTVAVSLVTSGGSVLTSSASSFCKTKGSVVLTAPSGSGYSYVWRLNGHTISGATSNTYTDTDSSGTYSVIIIRTGGCADTTNNVIVTANNTPTAVYTLSTDTVCSNSASFTLTGGTPAGGVYTIDGNSATTFNPSTLGAGAHTISYVATSSGCSDTASKTVIVKNCVGINEVELENGFRIYPNPAADVLNIESDLFSGINVTPVVFDLSGKSINAGFTRQANNRIAINTNTLSAGAYLVRFSINGQVVTKHFVKAAE